MNRTIIDRHLELLKESGISKETAFRAGVFSCTELEAKDLIGYGGSGLVFPYIDLSGREIGYRIKQDHPSKDSNGKVNAKYLTSKKSDAFIHFPLHELESIKTSKIMAIVEGEKKLLKFVQERDFYLPAVAIAGCWMFRRSNQDENELHPVLEELIAGKEKIFLIPDSDYFENKKVRAAFNKLSRIIYSKCKVVSIVDLRIGGSNA